MIVKEFLNQSIDIDVYDDTVEELGIAFVGPQSLTDIGQEHFEPVLNLEVDVFSNCAVVHLSDVGWEAQLELLKELFEGAAGFIVVSEYEKYFKEVA